MAAPGAAHDPRKCCGPPTRCQMMTARSLRWPAGSSGLAHPVGRPEGRGPSPRGRPGTAGRGVTAARSTAAHAAPTNGEHLAQKLIASSESCPIPRSPGSAAYYEPGAARSWPASAPTDCPTAAPRPSPCSSRRPTGSPADTGTTPTTGSACSSPPAAPAPAGQGGRPRDHAQVQRAVIPERSDGDWSAVTSGSASWTLTAFASDESGQERAMVMRGGLPIPLASGTAAQRTLLTVHIPDWPQRHRGLRTIRDSSPRSAAPRCCAPRTEPMPGAPIGSGTRPCRAEESRGAGHRACAMRRLECCDGGQGPVLVIVAGVDPAAMNGVTITAEAAPAPSRIAIMSGDGWHVDGSGFLLPVRSCCQATATKRRRDPRGKRSGSVLPRVGSSCTARRPTVAFVDASSQQTTARPRTGGIVEASRVHELSVGSRSQHGPESERSAG